MPAPHLTLRALAGCDAAARRNILVRLCKLAGAPWCSNAVGKGIYQIGTVTNQHTTRPASSLDSGRFFQYAKSPSQMATSRNSATSQWLSRMQRRGYQALG